MVKNKITPKPKVLTPASERKSKRKTPTQTAEAVERAVEGVGSKGAMRRLARRGGVKRVATLVQPEMQSALATFVKKLVTDAVIYADHGRRTTVTATDVIYALRQRKMHLYGYN